MERTEFDSARNIFHRMRSERKRGLWSRQEYTQAKNEFLACVPLNKRLWYTLVGIPARGSNLSLKYFGWQRWLIFATVCAGLYLYLV